MSNQKTHTFSEPLELENGAFIPEPTVQYHTWGKLNANRDNAVLVCHALTGNSNAHIWFSGLFGGDKTLDPNHQFIICANALGSCYGTSGPLSQNPDTGQLYRADFPHISVRDIVQLHRRLLDALNVRKVEFVIGGSLGGMQALEFSVMDDRAQAAICIGMGKNHSPWAVGISHTQRQAIYNDSAWNNGYYTAENQPRQGLSTARMIAMNSYRTPHDFENKFGRATQAETDLFQVESYLNYQGQKLADRFDAVSYVRLTQAMDSHDVARERTSYKDALTNVRIPIMVAGINSDMLYPVPEQKELARLLPNGQYVEISSSHGHDAFLIEFNQMNRQFVPFLNKTQQIEVS